MQSRALPRSFESHVPVNMFLEQCRYVRFLEKRVSGFGNDEILDLDGKIERDAFCTAPRTCTKARLFLVPVSPPVHFEGVENRNFFSGRAISEQHLSERAVL